MAAEITGFTVEDGVLNGRIMMVTVSALTPQPSPPLFRSGLLKNMCIIIVPASIIILTKICMCSHLTFSHIITAT